MTIQKWTRIVSRSHTGKQWGVLCMLLLPQDSLRENSHNIAKKQAPHIGKPPKEC